MKSIEQRDKEKKAHVKTEWPFRGRVVSLKLETYNLGDETKTTEVVHHKGAVAIVPVNNEGKILLVQQWRRAVQDIIIEIPAGTLEKGEDPIECAKRELQEEVGFGAKKIEALGGFYSAPGYSDEYIHLYLATDLFPSALEPDDDEMIDILPTSIDEAKAMIEANKICDAKTVAGILRYIAREM